MAVFARHHAVLAHVIGWHPSVLVLAALLLGCPQLHAGGKDKDPGKLTLDRIFAGPDFTGQPFGPVRWLHRTAAYTTRVPADQMKGAFDIVRVDPAHGERVTVWSPRNLVPASGSAPLAIEDYAWSSSEAQLLICTNSKRVWRKNTRGDYWEFDAGS